MAAVHSAMDLDRVGIWGHSAGGRDFPLWPFTGLSLPFLDLSLTFHCLSLTFR